MSDVESLTEMVGTGQSKRSSKSSESDANEFQLSLPQLASKIQAEANDSDSIDSDDEMWQQATSRNESDVLNSGNLQRILRASTLATYNEAVTTREGVSPRNVDSYLKSMRNSHFQVHRSFAIQDKEGSGSSPRTFSVTSSREQPEPKSYNLGFLKGHSRMGYFVAVIVVLVAATFAAKYFDVVLVVK